MTVPDLVSCEWLAEHLNDVRIVDVRWYLLRPHDGIEEYKQGHIPGAVFMDLDGELAAPVGAGPGRHPLPAPEVFAAAAGRAGIGPGVHVVAYDDQSGAIAARLWWLLRYFGHSDVSLLDGGLMQWDIEGRPLETSIPTYPPAPFVPRPHAAWVLDRAAVQALAADPRALLIDSRAAERYEGKTEPVDPRAGHIPGARSAPLAGNLRGPTDPRFKPADELRERYDALGASDASQIVAYCGSGVNACQTLLALHLAGFPDARLYEGSWSDWSSDPTLPAATGAQP